MTAAALLAPARLTLPLTTVDEGADINDYDDGSLQERINFARHAYLHALIYGEQGRERNWERRRTIQKTEGLFVVGLPQPDPAATPKFRRGPYRSLSEPFVEVKRMAAVAEEEVAPETVPSSPPDLSYSKSSESSGSSDSSDEEGEKAARFEDQSVDSRDSIEDRNLRPESRPTLKRPPPRSLTIGDGSRKYPSPPSSAKENRYPSLKGQVNGVLRDQSLNLPTGRGMRRVFSNPSAPNLMMHNSPRMSGYSRSPSPTKPFMQNGVSVSPQTLASATPRLSGEARSPGLSSVGQFARRQSWQPGRKSVQELEAECNNDDEEVPADAILENIPISPMPGQSRPSRSATPSPQRRPSYTNIPSHTNLHSANVPKMAKRPSAPTILPNGQYGTPRSPRHGKMPMLHHSNTMPAFIGEPFSRRHRSKSWTEDLNETTRELSAALEVFAERESMDKHGAASGTNSVASSPPRPSLSKQRAKTTILDLPSVEKGRIMIDPLPISKEKEAVLTKTRPSWLPPKDQKEEKRHMKEWGQMMARAMEMEKKRAVREREAQENQEEVKGSIARIWDQHVLPNWDVVVKEPRTRELWWRGVTPRSRGVVWHKAIGNDLELSESSFDAALKRAATCEEKVADMSPEDRAKSKEAAWLDAIARDIRSACLELQAPEKRAPFQNALRDVLKAYAMYRSDVGYVYGTHLVAGILCLHLKPVDAFVALANLLNRPLPLAFLVHDTAAMARTYDLVLSTLKYKFTRLHDHLTNPATGLSPEEYLDPMFRCLFAYHLPTELVARVWDIFVFEGDKVLVRAAVAVLGRLERRLYGSREEILDVISWRNEKRWDLGPEEEFITAVRDAGKVDAKGQVDDA